MKKLINFKAIGFALGMVLPVLAFAQPASEQKVREEITQQMKRYETALNASDTARIVKLYTKDGIFIPQYSQPAIGQDAIRRTYDGIFKNIKLNVRFTINEIQPMSKNWAFVRTQSKGTVKILGEKPSESAEGNNEIFILHREGDGQWRFARYLFASDKAPTAK
ncbi:YybH family protein [Acinetobacter nematophilus]|uniref:YybH family protein n=1 Tax=Acinetobacter nematophilus TaxID=2994642 RepID=UPI003AF67EA8